MLLRLRSLKKLSMLAKYGNNSSTYGSRELHLSNIFKSSTGTLSFVHILSPLTVICLSSFSFSFAILNTFFCPSVVSISAYGRSYALALTIATFVLLPSLLFDR